MPESLGSTWELGAILHVAPHAWPRWEAGRLQPKVSIFHMLSSAQVWTERGGNPTGGACQELRPLG